ncbi:MAG TPA: sugar phosphate isomerase/epimerase [Cyclobacteriaceae bacterium]|nr:sugar phosphate isomerase/epimerase [Cyclobacteriaceae bacterium]
MNRKDFLRAAGLTTAVAFAPSITFSKEKDAPAPAALNIGLASYTLRSLKLDDVIKTTKRLELNSIALKSMHMPLEASDEEVKAMAEKVRAAGLKLYGVGVIYMKTQQEVENAFRYAAAAGIETIVGVPNHDLLPIAQEQVKKYNIKLAIHNHGPGDDLYHSPNDVFAKIKDLDKRIGMCIDVGHVVRIKEDPIPMIAKYKDRLYDMHIKDVNKAENDGTPIEFGRGVIDLPGIIKALKKINYSNIVAIEYEKDGDDPIPGLAESVGYLRGIIKTS